METKDIRAVRAIFEESDVEFAGVFGSRAKGVATPESDLDMIVRFKKPTSLSKFARLQKKLCEELQIPVDLVTERSLSPYIKDEALKNMHIIYGTR